MAATDPLQTPVTLPCGTELPNRIVKAAMTEGLADSLSRPTPELCRLYETWSKGGTGMLLTGNVQVDRRYMERPGNVAIDGPQDEEQMAMLRAFAKAGQAGGSKIFVQLGHAGRQSTMLVNKNVKGPSAIPIKNLHPDAPSDGTCGAFTLEELEDIKERFVAAGKVCQEAGFDGVQLHAAHGYLLSSMLNPLANQREDDYGGSLENRARLLLDVVRELRFAVGPSFAIAVKINSADFQKGGFTTEECGKVVRWLDELGVDLIELSGGNYESPVMAAAKPGEDLSNLDPSNTKGMNASTVRREAFFLDFAVGVRKHVQNAKVMVTGGFRSRETMENALSNGDCDLVGVGRPLAGDLAATNKLFAGEIDRMPSFETDLQLPWWLMFLKPFDIYNKLQFFTVMAFLQLNFVYIGQGKAPAKYRHLLTVRESLQFDRDKAKALEGIDCVGSYYKPF